MDCMFAGGKINTSYHMHTHQTVLALCALGKESERETSIPIEARSVGKKLT